MVKLSKEKLEKVEKILNRFPKGQSSLIGALHSIQLEIGYLPEEVQKLVAEKLGIPESTVYGVVTFYNFFRREPVGKYIITVCEGTACHVRGAPEIVKELEKVLGIKVGHTTPDGMFTLDIARCFGCCGLAPVLMVNEDIHGRVTPESVRNIISKYGG
ncbi:MAG: NADH-quinone oxidoreductase subunit NuoE [Synergistetes bacterium]|nr:NADH-quinone oxidoreductase subunit NuoE [Synergistota bacterium]MCX8128162.1 NADH-quinone oxidoreductase subunit NuoE [Synergistota bacterium]MDW8192538.1 NADH-quinone oxidoreductase subunit NuoE [Synergistota bacterium]